MTRKNMAEQFFQDALNTIKESQSELEKGISGYTSGFSNKPLVDIIEDNNSLIVKADLPGFKKENIKVDIGDFTLEIIAHYEGEFLDDGAYYFKNERKYGEIRRVLELPSKIKAELAQASFKEGVLEIILPKIDKTEVNID